jgi:hypothetical protein
LWRGAIIVKLLAVEAKMEKLLAYLKKNFSPCHEVIKDTEYVLAEIKAEHKRWRDAARKRNRGGYGHA